MSSAGENPSAAITRGSTERQAAMVTAAVPALRARNVPAPQRGEGTAVTAAIGVRAGGLGPNNKALAACESPVQTDGAFSCGVTGLRD